MYKIYINHSLILGILKQRRVCVCVCVCVCIFLTVINIIMKKFLCIKFEGSSDYLFKALDLLEG